MDDFVQRVNEMNKKLGSDCNMCRGRMNLAIVMDGSGSIGDNDYRFAKRAAEGLIDTFSNELVDVGYVLFSSTVEVIFPLRSNLTRDQMKKNIDESRYPDGGTRTDLGIDEGVTILGKADNHTGEYSLMVTCCICDSHNLFPSLIPKLLFFYVHTQEPPKSWLSSQMANLMTHILPYRQLNEQRNPTSLYSLLALVIISMKII